MSRVKILIAAAIFLAATCIKFTLPTAANVLREELHSVMERDTDLRAVMTTIGEKLSSEDLVSAFGRMHSEQTGTPVETQTLIPGNTAKRKLYRPVSLKQLREYRTEGLGKVPIAETIVIRTEENTETVEQNPAMQQPEQVQLIPTAVEQFLDAQSVFSDHALPDGVSYAMPGLKIGYSSPVLGTTSSGFGYRVHPISGEVKFHYGTDFAAWTGTDIRSFAEGYVSVAGEDSGYGNYLILTHGDGCETLYAHCSELLVTTGEAVSAGQVIARVGETGQVTGPHLHFELKQDGVYLNPEYYVN